MTVAKNKKGGSEQLLQLSRKVGISVSNLKEIREIPHVNPDNIKSIQDARWILRTSKHGSDRRRAFRYMVDHTKSLSVLMQLWRDGTTDPDLEDYALGKIARWKSL